jgi:cytidylate kinase
MAKISIFGFAGTGKTTAGRLLAEKLMYRYLSTGNMFRDRALKMGITLQELDMLCKTDPTTDKSVDAEIEEFGKNNDDFVIESRLAWHFIPDSYKVMLDCDFDTRIKRIASREGKEFDLVANETREREDAIRERYQKYYNITDVGNPAHFDLVIDTTSIPPDEIVNNIINHLKEKKII